MLLFAEGMGEIEKQALYYYTSKEGLNDDFVELIGKIINSEKN